VRSRSPSADNLPKEAKEAHQPWSQAGIHQGQHAYRNHRCAGTRELDTADKKSTVQIRDVCVHGVLNSYDHHKIEIGKVDSRGEQHLIENFTIDRNRLEHSASSLSFLQEQWGSIALALVKQAANA
jgi:hypothetical protein